MFTMEIPQDARRVKVLGFEEDFFVFRMSLKEPSYAAFCTRADGTVVAEYMRGAGGFRFRAEPEFSDNEAAHMLLKLTEEASRG